MFAIVALPYDSLKDLPPLEFKLMAALLRYANKAGECWPTLRQLAVDIGKSEATVCRAMRRLADDYGCFTERTRRGNGRYRYRIAERFLPRWPSQSSDCTTVQDGLAPSARQEAKPVKQTRDSLARFAKIDEGLPRATDWEPRLRGWLKRGFWLPAWGPRPNEPGCWAPLQG